MIGVKYCSNDTTIACSLSENGKSVERCLGRDYICNGKTDCPLLFDDEYGCSSSSFGGMLSSLSLFDSITIWLACTAQISVQFNLCPSSLIIKLHFIRLVGCNLYGIERIGRHNQISILNIFETKLIITMSRWKMCRTVICTELTLYQESIYILLCHKLSNYHWSVNVYQTKKRMCVCLPFINNLSLGKLLDARTRSMRERVYYRRHTKSGNFQSCQ